MRYSHEKNTEMLADDTGEMTWARVISVEAPRVLFDEDGQLREDVNQTAFVDLLAHLLVEKPGLPPVFGVAAEVFDGGGSEITYKLWYHSMMEIAGPKCVTPEDIATPLHADERLENLPGWVHE